MPITHDSSVRLSFKFKPTHLSVAFRHLSTTSHIELNHELDNQSFDTVLLKYGLEAVHEVINRSFNQNHDKVSADKHVTESISHFEDIPLN